MKNSNQNIFIFSYVNADSPEFGAWEISVVWPFEDFMINYFIRFYLIFFWCYLFVISFEN